MKIILLQDVPKVGKKYEIKDAPNGLARNFLIPKGYAEIATPVAIKNIERAQGKKKADEKEKNKAIRDIVDALNGKTVTVVARASENGGLFAKITAKDIGKAIKNEFNAIIPESIILLEEPLKKTGEYEIQIKNGENNARVKVTIQAA